MKISKRNQKGFTIVELLIATAIFSVVLLVFLTALLRISQLFYKGVSLSNTQEATRNVMQSIADDIQFFHEGPGGDEKGGYICIGDHRYSFQPGVQVGSAPDHYGLVRETRTCKAPVGVDSVDTTKAERLLDPGMQLNKLSVSSLSGTTIEGGYLIEVMVVYYGGDNRVFSSELAGYDNDFGSAGYNAYMAPDARCTGLPNSTQFCATSEYQTTILQRF